MCPAGFLSANPRLSSEFHQPIAHPTTPSNRSARLTGLERPRAASTGLDGRFVTEGARTTQASPVSSVAPFVLPNAPACPVGWPRAASASGPTARSRGTSVRRPRRGSARPLRSAPRTRPSGTSAALRVLTTGLLPARSSPRATSPVQAASTASARRSDRDPSETSVRLAAGRFPRPLAGLGARPEPPQPHTWLKACTSHAMAAGSGRAPRGPGSPKPRRARLDCVLDRKSVPRSPSPRARAPRRSCPVLRRPRRGC